LDRLFSYLKLAGFEVPIGGRFWVLINTLGKAIYIGKVWVNGKPRQSMAC